MDINYRDFRIASFIFQAHMSSPFWPLFFPLSLSLSLKVICDGSFKLCTQEVNRLLFCVCPVRKVHDHLLGRGDSGTVICHPSLYEWPTVLAQNEFSLLSKYPPNLFSGNRLPSWPSKAKEKFSICFLPGFFLLASPHRTFPVAQSSVLCRYTVCTIC